MGPTEFYKVKGNDGVYFWKNFTRFYKIFQCKRWSNRFLPSENIKFLCGILGPYKDPTWGI